MPAFPSAVLALALQATPPPPPVLTSPAPSPIPSASPLPPSPAALSASVSALNLHPSQAGTLTVSAANGNISAQLDVPLAAITIDQAAHTITANAGTQTGRATLTITDAAGNSLQIPLRVALDAGGIPPSVTLQITGTTLDPAWLQQQIGKAVTSAVQMQPGAAVQLAAFALPPALTPGSSAAVPVPVHIGGGTTYYDVDAPTTVNIQNIAVAPFAPPLLFYDDDPEKLNGFGLIYRGQVAQTAPARLYYYHQNIGEPRELFVVLQSFQGPATVQLIDASAGANVDVMSVGHAVSRNFLQQKAAGEGIVIDLAPAPGYVVDGFAMNPLEGVAGSIGIRVLSGGAVSVAVIAAPPQSSLDQAVAYLAQPPLPGDGHHRTGVFDIGGNYATEVLSYSVGGQDATTDYGATSPPPAQSTTGHDYGQYGVLRSLTFDLSNATAQSSTVYVFEQPIGGVVRSSFLVNGRLVQVGCARLPQRYQIGTPFILAPNSNTQLVVQTMTDGGSNYPLEVGVTATPPQPTTPPISAPDGCFPKPAATPVPSPSALPLPSPAPSPSRK